MWKMLLAFAVFAAVAMFVLIQSGADVDMGGEKHGIDATHTEETHSVVPAASVASAASEAASAASN
jgi:hypothetical protein